MKFYFFTFQNESYSDEVPFIQGYILTTEIMTEFGVPTETFTETTTKNAT